VNEIIGVRLIMKTSISTVKNSASQTTGKTPKIAAPREALARGEIKMRPETLVLLESRSFEDGQVLHHARRTGVQAAKDSGALLSTGNIAPLTHCEVEFNIPESRDRLIISASVKTVETGAEMMALDAAGAAALSVYRACKPVDDLVSMSTVRLCD
jgi:cyclic pyranopterin monophosphate synthase